MRKLPGLAWAIACPLLFSSLCAAQKGKVDTLGPLTETSVAEAGRQVLDCKGYRVALDDGTPGCEMWTRKSIAAQPKSDAADLLYPELAESLVAEVLAFPKAGQDSGRPE